MKTITIDGNVHTDIINEAAEVLQQGGLVCIPVNGSYRIVADLWNPSAVLNLLQSKRRVKKKPSLVFISDKSQLSKTTDQIDPLNFKLMNAFWPGPLTLLLDPHPDLPRKISKELSKANGSLGIRIPVNPLARRIVTAFGGPLLVSSANRNAKIGDSSTDQIRRNFSQNVSLFLDAGDFNQSLKSTCVEVVNGQVKVIREGLITEDMILDVTQEAEALS